VGTGRVNRRLEQPRERVLAAAFEMVAEDGLASLTMASLGRRLGTSGGHLLYYFGTKDQLLLETLRWSEETFTAPRERLVATAGTLRAGVHGFCDLYLPDHRSDPRWLLWLQVWARAPYDDAIGEGQRELEAPWRTDLGRLLARFLGPRAARSATTASWVEGTLAMLDGFSIALVTGAPVDRDALLRTVTARAGQVD
jgi:AcrR family transcriptional regulator